MDISQITDYLWVGSEPKVECLDEIHRRRVRLIISMIGARRPPDIFARPPCRLLWLETFDTFLTPIPIRKLIEGVEAALPVIQAGGCVFVFCAQGRHRSVAMASAVLVALGYPAGEAMRLIQTGRQTAHPQAWHIRRQILVFEKRWATRSQNLPQHLYDLYCDSMAGGISYVIRRLGLDKGILARRL